jgi:hypothetical protein
MLTCQTIPDREEILKAVENQDLKGDDAIAKVCNVFGSLIPFDELKAVCGVNLAKILRDGNFGYFGVDSELDKAAEKY